MSTLLALALLTAAPHDKTVPEVRSVRLLPRDMELPAAGLLTGRVLLTPVLMAAGGVLLGAAAFGVGLLLTIPFPIRYFTNRDPDYGPLAAAVGTGAVIGALFGALGAAAFGSPDPFAELRIALPFVVLLTALVGGAALVATIIGAPLVPVLAIASSSFCTLPVITAFAKVSRARELYGVEVAAF